MSIAHHIYTAICPKALRTRLTPYRQRFQAWKRQRSIRRRKRKLSAPSACRARRKKLRRILNERPLKVAFQVAQLGKWKCESVLQLMQQDARFEPFIWSVPVSGVLHIKNPQAHEQEVQRVVNAFTERGIHVSTYACIDKFPAEERPDLIFIHEAYDDIFPSESYRGLTEELICYVPYALHTSNNATAFDGIGNNAAVLNFIENEAFCAFAAQHATHKGRNSVVTGTPLADIFLSERARSEQVWKDCGKPMKKVIWAPHWTITPNLCWFVSGTFLKNAEAMLALAKKHSNDIQFAFKPHPHLHRILCDLPEWGKEKTDAFYRTWQEMPNTQLEEGAYTGLFMQSDAIIHDSGSFIQEYLFADKPGLFLRDNGGYGDYNSMTIDCLQAYQHGLTEADIESFLQHNVLDGEDPKKELRRELRRRYIIPPHGQSSAQNILDALLNV